VGEVPGGRPALSEVVTVEISVLTEVVVLVLGLDGSRPGAVVDSAGAAAVVEVEILSRVASFHSTC